MNPSLLSQIDRRFFNAAPDPNIFQFEGKNLAKLFLDEYCARQYESVGKGWSPKRNTRTVSDLVKNIIRLIQGISKILSAGKMEKEYVFYGAHGRTIEENGNTYDLYNYHVVQKLGRDKCLILEAIPAGKKKIFQPDLLLHDFVIPRIIFQLLIQKKIKFFVKRLVSDCPALDMTEKDVNAILLKYLAQKKILETILRAYGIRKAFIICHYGRGAFTAACKSLKIEVIELMHGLIFPSNSYYCSSQISPAYLNAIRGAGQLPDKLYVFGPKWKDLISPSCYFARDDILVSGYYLKTQVAPESGKAGNRTIKAGKKIILITTQPLYQNELVGYINYLKTRLGKVEWKIIIKIHPNENGEIYNDLCEEGFVEISPQSVYRLLPVADFHISVSSTVLFEALLFDVYNFVLFVPWEETACNEIIMSGAARKLGMNEVPMPYVIDKHLKSRYFSDLYLP